MPRKPTTDPKKSFVAGGWRVKIAGVIFRLGPNEYEAEKRRRKLVAQWLDAGGPGTPAPVEADDPEGMTVAGAIAEYLERGLRGSINQRNRIRARDALLTVAEHYGDELAESFGALELKRVREKLARRTTKPKCSERTSTVGKNAKRRRPRKPFKPRPLSRKYINQIISTIKTAWDWLASERIVPAYRAQELRTVKAWREGDGGEELPDILPAPAADIDAALQHLNSVVAAMVRLQLLSGMRPNEVRRMTRADISTSASEVLHPPNALPTSALTVGDVVVWVYAPQRHKNRKRGKPRLIALSPACQEILRPFLDAAPPDECLFRPVDAAGGRTALGGKPVATQYTEASYAHAVRRACLRAGVKPWKPGQLRHGVATDLFPEDPIAAMSVLGHGQLAMTQYYAAVTLRKAAEVAAKQKPIGERRSEAG